MVAWVWMVWQTEMWLSWVNGSGDSLENKVSFEP